MSLQYGFCSIGFHHWLAKPLPAAIEQLMFDVCTGPVAVYVLPLTPFHWIARPLSRPASIAALQLPPDASQVMTICTAPLTNCITPVSLLPSKRSVLPLSPGPASLVAEASRSRRNTRAK